MRIRNIDVGPEHPFVLIAGPCVIESRDIVFEIAERMLAITARLGIPYVFKASFDKANRTSASSFRGPGLDEGLSILREVREKLGLPVLTDVHDKDQVAAVADAVDVLQTPAFLCRQTDFIQAVASAGKPVNIKKGQFLAPWDMAHVAEKAKATGNDQIMLCDRGTSFGYNTLVSDMRGLATMRETGCPVIFDTTHSVQQPGGLGGASGGQSHLVPVVARAAVAAGVSGVFMETHPRPTEALSDGPTMWPLDRAEELLGVLVSIDTTVKAQPFAETSSA
ncbi:MAG: 3-deoxy-8-phosphooctulonate synthase [Sandaracinaceae bacterium]